MNHKRKKPPKARAGCKMCKPNKIGHGMENKLCHTGFGKLRDDFHTKADLDLARRYQMR
jgi:hypothetical protein